MHPGLKADIEAILALDINAAFAPQVVAHLEKLGDLNEYDIIGLPGQAVAAIVMLPIMEMACGLPHRAEIIGFGQDAKVAGSIDLDAFRHNIVRPHRAEIAQGEAWVGYTVLDGAGRGLTPDQLAELAAALDCQEADIRVINISPGQVNLALPAEEQERLATMLVATGLTVQDWTGGRVLYLPAGHGGVAAVQATAIYGLSEVWPRVIRLNKVGEGFHLAEVVDPQAGRQVGVAMKAAWAAQDAPVLVPRDLLLRVLNALKQEGSGHYGLAEQVADLLGR